MDNETIDVRSLQLAVGYITCVRELLKDLWAANVIPAELENKYKLKKLANGLIDIQNP